MDQQTVAMPGTIPLKDLVAFANTHGCYLRKASKGYLIIPVDAEIKKKAVAG